MKNNLLAVVVDKNCILQAKQLFSSAYFNAGWDGDYMLLAQEIAENDLKWFKNKKIIIKNIEPISNISFGRISNATLGRFYLFTQEFKNWKNIIYLDVDIILRSSINELTNIKGFAAVTEGKMKDLFIKSPDLYKKMTGKYDFRETRFNSGVLAFSTDIINEKSFDELTALFEEYKESIRGDQEIINLFFYKKWRKLPSFYNTNVYKTTACYLLGRNRLKGVLHFIGDNKPWNKNNPFYREWEYNLARAEFIDLDIPCVIKKNSIEDIIKYSKRLKIKETIFRIIVLIDKTIGKIGIISKKLVSMIFR